MKFTQWILITSTIMIGSTSHAGRIEQAREALRKIFREKSETPEEIARGQQQISEAIKRRAAERPKSCGLPRFADACSRSSSIADLKDGSLAVVYGQNQIHILRPEPFSKPDVILDIPQRGYNNATSSDRALSLQVINNELFLFDGSLGASNGGKVSWKLEDLSLRHAQYAVMHDGKILDYTVSMRPDSDTMYVRFTEQSGFRAHETPKLEEFSGQIQLEPGEKVTSVKEFNAESKTLRVISERNGQRTERIASVKDIPTTPAVTSTGLPTAASVR